MTIIYFVLIGLVCFVIGVSAGHNSLKGALEKEGYALVYRKNKQTGKGAWRVYNRKLFTFGGEEVDGVDNKVD